MNTTTFFFRRSHPVRSLLGRFASSSTRKPALALSAPPVVQPLAANRKKILLVDDDAIILRTTSMKLQSQGYAVITAMDGAAAIQAVRKEKPDLILLDISFPTDAGGGSVQWDGFLIMSWLRRIDEARDIPFVVITGGDPAKYEDRSLATGATAFFHKPLDHASLLSLIERTVVEHTATPQTGFDINFQI